MYYRFNALVNRLVPATHLKAFQPQGLLPASKVITESNIEMDYEPVTCGPSTIDKKKAGARQYGEMDPKLKEMQQLFQADDSVPVHLKKGMVDQVMYYTTLGTAIAGAAISIFVIGQLALPKKPE